jgi:hypothetical protein
VSRQPDDATPILTHKHHAAPSIFTPQGLLREARRQKGLPDATVPPVCALDPDGDLVRRLTTAGGAPRSCLGVLPHAAPSCRARWPRGWPRGKRRGRALCRESRSNVPFSVWTQVLMRIPHLPLLHLLPLLDLLRNVQIADCRYFMKPRLSIHQPSVTAHVGQCHSIVGSSFRFRRFAQPDHPPKLTLGLGHVTPRRDNKAEHP